MKKHS